MIQETTFTRTTFVLARMRFMYIHLICAVGRLKALASGPMMEISTSLDDKAGIMMF